MTEVTLEQVKQSIEKMGQTWEVEKKAIDAKYDELAKKGAPSAETVEKLAKIEKDMAELASLKTRFADMQVALKRMPTTGKTEEEKPEDYVEAKNAWRGFIRGKGVRGEAEFAYDKHNPAENKKSLSVVSDPDGGFLVLAEWSDRMIQRVFESSPIRQYAQVVTIGSDRLKGLYDDNEISSGWVGETGARPQTNTAALGEWTIPVHELYAMPAATQQLLDDARMDVEGWLMRKGADKFARVENAAFVNGTGAGQPRGFLSLASGTTLRTQIERVASGSSANVTADKVIALAMTLKKQYRDRAVFAANRTTWSQIRQLKDSQNRYLWQPDYQAGQPDRLIGIPTTEFNDMPDPAASSLSLAIADWQEAYCIVDRVGIRTLRDPFTAKPYILFYMTKRTGGDVLNTEAIKLMSLA